LASALAGAFASAFAGAFASALASSGASSIYAMDGSIEKVRDLSYLTASVSVISAMTANDNLVVFI